METNESILTRSVVGLGDKKVLGKVADLRIDCETLGVSHYIVHSASTNAPLALPFAAALSVGDTFLTVQSRDEFVPAGTDGAQAVMDGYALRGVEAYSRTGNKLGTVASYGFDPVFGTVTSLVLEDGSTFAADRFVFFAPEFVFVDDGAKTAAELRAEGAEGAQSVPAPAPAEAADSDQVEAAEGDQEKPVSPEDAELMEFLLDAELTDDVTSKDGEFSAEKGTKLTQEIIQEAYRHDALLLLTLSVEA